MGRARISLAHEMSEAPPLAKEVPVLGLDLSLTRSAACAIPAGWAPGDWDALRFETAGFKVEKRDPAECARRLRVVAEAMFRFVEWWHSEKGVRDVFVEDHAWGIGQSNIVTAELVGCVKRDLYEHLGIVAIPVNQNSVRKYLLGGKLPQGKRGMAVAMALKAAGWPHEGSDEGDSFAVANYGRTELGLPGVVLGR